MIRRDYLIIGAGLGGAAVCEALRQYDPNGSVVLIGNEAAYPYIRPRIRDCVLLADSPSLEEAYYLPPDWYTQHNIDLRRNTLVTQLNVERRLAVLATGQVIEFRKACLAMGSRPHRPRVAGANLGNIIAIRTVKDAIALRETAPGVKDLYIIGGGIVATQVATTLKGMGLSPKFMNRSPTLWQKRLDPETSAWLTRYFEERGIPLIHETLNGFEGKTILRNIQTKEGRSLPAGLAILAVGTDLNLGLVQNTPLASPLGTPVNELMETDEKGIYAVGDIALHPDLFLGGARRSPYSHNTLQQAAIAGGNITGKKRQRYKGLPYFRTQALDLTFDFVGDFSFKPVQFELQGEREKESFIIRYSHGGRLRGILLCNQPENARAAAEAELLQQSDAK